MVATMNATISKGRKTAPSQRPAIVEPDALRAARLKHLKALVDSGDYKISSSGIAERIVDEWFGNPPTVALESEAAVVELVKFGLAPEPVCKQNSSPMQPEVTARRQSRRSLRPSRNLFGLSEWINLRRLQSQLSRVARYAHL